MALNPKDITLIGEEMVRVLEPVYEELGEVKEKLSGVQGTIQSIDKRLGRVEDKVDALTGDVLDLQTDVKVINDQFVGVNEKLTKDRKDIMKIQSRLGLPL